MHYDESRRAGELEGERKTGRPKGKVSITTPPPEEDEYVPSWDELMAKSKQVMWKILTSDSASQAERNNVLRIMGQGKQRGGVDPRKAAQFAEMVGSDDD